MPSPTPLPGLIVEVWREKTIVTRLLANEFGLAGRSNLEAAQADEIVDAVADLIAIRYAAMFEPNEAAKSEKTRAFLQETLPKGLVSSAYFRSTHLTSYTELTQERLEKLLEERGGQFTVGNRLSWADLHIFGLLEREAKNNPEVPKIDITKFFPHSFWPHVQGWPI